MHLKSGLIGGVVVDEMDLIRGVLLLKCLVIAYYDSSKTAISGIFKTLCMEMDRHIIPQINSNLYSMSRTVLEFHKIPITKVKYDLKVNIL